MGEGTATPPAAKTRQIRDCYWPFVVEPPDVPAPGLLGLVGPEGLIGLLFMPPAPEPPSLDPGIPVPAEGLAGGVVAKPGFVVEPPVVPGEVEEVPGLVPPIPELAPPGAPIVPAPAPAPAAPPPPPPAPPPWA